MSGKILDWAEIFAKGLHLKAGKDATSLNELATNLSKLAKRTLTYDAIQGAAKRHGQPTPMEWMPHFAASVEAHHLAPSGYRVKRVSQFVKTADFTGWRISNADEEQRHAATMAAIESIAKPFRGKGKLPKVPRQMDPDRLPLYLLGDMHVGLMTSLSMTGEKWDLETAEDILCSSVDRLVDVAPETEHCAIFDAGDSMHVDGPNNTTTKGTPQGVSGSFFDQAYLSLRMRRRFVESSLRKAKFCHLHIAPGNHDAASAAMSLAALGLYYEGNPRVIVEMSPRVHQWMRWGECLLMLTHKPSKGPELAMAMASMLAKDWGETRHRKIYTGHVHHQSVKDYPGVTVQSLRVQVPPCEWAMANNYGAPRGMLCEIWDKRYGHVTSNEVGIDMARVLAGQAA